MTGVEQARIDAVKGCTTWDEADEALARVDACVTWFTGSHCWTLLGTALARTYFEGRYELAVVMFDTMNPPP